ncbi:hypothetical protein [Synechococcus sp. PCC 6312]|uniref:hypothetical protein n=1 Tax=Synechococcus sp. (strain ATCC 27167 / PCC 6312) TaxID=195253 RepID=UPI00029F26B8|nr:hypothetical protein [Synechococcus sp. PCC 6312]AFY61852.1 hypothetical protein Syn6312_2772 [Synechococcus sp. PCC 6312]
MSEMTETIQKIKIGGSKSTIWLNRYMQDGSIEEVQFHVRGKVHPDLQDSLNQLMSILIEETRLADDWNEGAIIGLNLKPQGEEGYGIQATAKLEVERTISINSRTIQAYEIPQHQATIKKIIKECEACINGKRGDK